MNTVENKNTTEERFKLFDWSQEKVRVLHYTWIAFFLTFYVWFNFAPLKSAMIETFTFLTEENFKSLLLCNVALTIPARILIGSLVDKYGPRVTFSGLMIVTIIPGLLFAFGNTFAQLVISRLLLSSVGAGFVIGIKMTANWFPARHIGRAEGFYAGWGNFGSAAAAGLIPVIGLSLIGGEMGWRWSLALSSIVTALYGVFYYFKVKDYPTGKEPKGKAAENLKKSGVMPVSSWGGLFSYLLWTMPLFVALGILSVNLQKQQFIVKEYHAGETYKDTDKAFQKADAIDILVVGGTFNFIDKNDEVKIYKDATLLKTILKKDSALIFSDNRALYKQANKVQIYRKGKLKTTIKGKAILKTYDALKSKNKLTKAEFLPLYNESKMSSFFQEGIVVKTMKNMFSMNILYLIFGSLAAFYIYQAFTILKFNIPRLRAGIPEEEKYHFPSVGALNTTYFANFGAELAVVSMLPMFFEGMFNLTPQMAGFVAMSFAFVNLFARPLGGYLSDMMGSRKRTMLIYMIGITLGFFLMGLITKNIGIGEDGKPLLAPMFEGAWWLVVSVIITMFCSLFVQGAEGATFAMIPSIKKELTGRIAGMAGAYGNVGAVFYLFVLTIVDYRTFFFILAIGAGVSVLACYFMLKEPEGSFEDEH